jgi:hypothetical protein
VPLVWVEFGPVRGPAWFDWESASGNSAGCGAAPDETVTEGARCMGRKQAVPGAVGRNILMRGYDADR